MNRYITTVQYSLEKNLTSLFARITFGAGGVPTLDTQNSKGICNVSLNAVSFTGTTSSGSPTITAVSSFAGLYNGMTVQDSGPTNVNQKISSMSAGGPTITLAGNATGTNTGLTATGGQYLIQFGAQAGVRLDTQYKFLGIGHNWDESANQGGASTLALAPLAPSMFVVGNKTSVRTIPQTAASVLTDCTLLLQFGSGSGSSFVAAAPSSGDAVRIEFIFGNCSAP